MRSTRSVTAKAPADTGYAAAGAGAAVVRSSVEVCSAAVRPRPLTVCDRGIVHFSHPFVPCALSAAGVGPKRGWAPPLTALMGMRRPPHAAQYKVNQRTAVDEQRAAVDNQNNGGPVKGRCNAGGCTVGGLMGTSMLRSVHRSIVPALRR